MKIVRTAAFLLGVGALFTFLNALLVHPPYPEYIMEYGWARSGAFVDGVILILGSLWRPWGRSAKAAMIAGLGYYAGDNTYVALTWFNYGWRLPVGFLFQIVPTAAAWIGCAYCIFCRQIPDRLATQSSEK